MASAAAAAAAGSAQPGSDGGWDQGLRLANANGALNFAPTLHTIDNHRVVAALEKAIERLQLLTLLNYETPADAQSLLGGTAASGAGSPSATVKADKGVGALLDEQKRLEARYELLLAATKQVHPNPYDPALDPQCFAHIEDPDRRRHLEELRVVSRLLKEQSKQLCRQLKENPNDADNWKKIVTERSTLLTMLAACVRELTSGSSAAAADGADTSVGTSAGPSSQQQHQQQQQQQRVASYEQFAKKVLDEQAAQVWADDLVKKEKEINQNVKQLQSEVKLERANKERELGECHQRLADLKTELRVLKRALKERSDKLRAETEAASEGQQRKALDQQRVVRDGVVKTRDAVRNEQEVHADFMAHIQERGRALEEVAAKWDQRYQEEIKRTEARRVDVDQTRRECADRLRERTEARVLAHDERRQRQAEKRIEEEERTALESRSNDEYAAATQLQAAIKGLFTRLALVALKKKAGKKKK